MDSMDLMDIDCLGYWLHICLPTLRLSWHWSLQPTNEMKYMGNTWSEQRQRYLLLSSWVGFTGDSQCQTRGGTLTPSQTETFYSFLGKKPAFLGTNKYISQHTLTSFFVQFFKPHLHR